MEIYKGFARIYDSLMHDAPYGVWAAQIDRWMKKNPGDGQGIILDLGCGTGSVSVLMAEKGYSIIGVDSSEDMLAAAQAKTASRKADVMFIRQDIRELDLYGTVQGAFSVFDVMNYILDAEDLLKVFTRVRIFLEQGCPFVFDMNTLYKFKFGLRSEIYSGTGSGGESYVWNNVFSSETMINTYDMLFFSPEAQHGFREKHLQRAYECEEVARLLKLAGFQYVEIKNGYTDEPIKEDSLRAVFVTW